MELLGFMVLGGPFVFAIAWIVVALPIAILLGKKYTAEENNKRKKLLKKLAIVAVVMLLPYVDAIAGRVYLSYLCHFEAGPRVYHTVELPDEYWNGDGMPNIFNNSGYLDREFWISNIDEKSHTINYSILFSIDKDVTETYYKSTNQLLGEVVTFRHFGGWLKKKLSHTNTASSCSFVNDSNFSIGFYGQMFVPESKQ